MASQLHASFGERLGEGRCKASLLLGSLRTDWQFDDAFVKKIDMPWNPATPNKDGWGSLYYIVCDFNNDGQVPNPELMTVPPKPGATQKELNTRIALFSAGPDGDPATWEDNMPPGFTQ